MSAHLSAKVPLFNPRIRIHLSMYLTIVLSTDTQNWHAYDPFKIPALTAQRELIDTSHYQESCISRFLLICGLMGCKGSWC
jgi:hypothetical protein